MPVQYGYGKQLHEGLTHLFDKNHFVYQRWLLRLISFECQFRLMAEGNSAFPVSLTSGWNVAFDLFSFYTFLAHVRPKRVVEIGSGYSTRCAINCIRSEDLPTRITVINPSAESWMDDLPEIEKVHKAAVHEVSLDIFDLFRGDILYIDGSHKALMGSDVVTVFLEVLPKLRKGVIVHLHDIFLPMDYWPHFEHWEWSEQYMLAVLLLFSPDRYKVLLPVRYCSEVPGLISILEPIRDLLVKEGLPRREEGLDLTGGSFWMESQ